MLVPRQDLFSPAIWKTSAPVPVRQRPPKPERAVVSTPELQILRSALAAIPNNDVSYDEWFRIACAVHYATDGEGLELFREWSAKSAKHDDDFLETRVWPYLGVSSAEPITERSLFALAAQHGWQDPTIADDFEVVEAPVEEDFDVIGETEPGKSFKYRLESVPEFCSRPMPTWIIKGVLPQADLGVLFGESGSGKSFIALDMAAAVARGVEWRGRKVKQGRVVIVAAEGASGFRKRLRAYCHQNQVEQECLDIHTIDATPNLRNKPDAVELAKSIGGQGGADLVIVDTFAQTLFGNENSGEDVGEAVANCRGIGRHLGGAMVLLVHHSGKDSSKGARGWSGLRAAADVEIEVTRSGDDRALTVSKQKDGEDGGQFGFRLVPVLLGTDEDGDDVTSCVVTHCEAVAVRKVQPKGANQKIALRVFSETDGLAVDGDGVQREDLIRGIVEQMPFDAAERKKDRRREMAVKAIESVIEAGFLRTEGTRLLGVRT